jgi:hypothetical protein
MEEEDMKAFGFFLTFSILGIFSEAALAERVACSFDPGQPNVFCCAVNRDVDITQRCPLTENPERCIQCVQARAYNICIGTGSYNSDPCYTFPYGFWK